MIVVSLVLVVKSIDSNLLFVHFGFVGFDLFGVFLVGFMFLCFFFFFGGELLPVGKKRIFLEWFRLDFVYKTLFLFSYETLNTVNNFS